ncbi:GtrA family protein [Oscillibacter sp.]|uniref:GtrA family protein n=1 Tax=Oscillibacter sp. TaxID=1945593 RepID=UPI0037CA4659
MNEFNDVKQETIRFLKFGLVGISNVLVALCIYYLFLYFGTHYILANTIGYIVSVFNSYLWNSKFVFKHDHRQKMNKLIKTYLAYGVTYCINSICLWLLVDIMDISDTLAPILVLFIVVPINYIMSRFWVYTK